MTFTLIHKALKVSTYSSFHCFNTSAKTHLGRNKSEYSQRLRFTVSLLSYTCRNLACYFNAFTIFPSKNFHLSNSECVLWTFQFNFDDVIITPRKFTCYPANMSWIQVYLLNRNIKMGTDIATSNEKSPTFKTNLLHTTGTNTAFTIKFSFWIVRLLTCLIINIFNLMNAD